MNVKETETKELPPFFEMSLKCLERTVENMSVLVKALTKQKQELKSDLICGHWLGLDTDCSATVIKSGQECYMVSFFHDGYMSGQAMIYIHREELLVENLSRRTLSKVFLFDENNRLVIDKYGTFIRDHVLGYVSSNDVQCSNRKKLKYKHLKK